MLVEIEILVSTERKAITSTIEMVDVGGFWRLALL